MAVKVIKADSLEEAMEEMVKTIKKEIESEDDDCKNCEDKKECEMKQAEFRGKELLNAMYAVLRLLVKEEHREQLDKDFEEFKKDENAWMFAYFLEDLVEEMANKFFVVLHEKDLKEGILKICSANIKSKNGK